MRSVRTDLAVEARDAWRESGRGGLPDGVAEEDRTVRGFGVTVVRVLDGRGEKELCKPKGSYVTIELGRLLRREDNAFADGAEALASELRALLRLERGAGVLVVGLGNPAITPDAVGHLAAKSTMATRHLTQRLPQQFGGFRSVAVLEPGVLGTTGLESAEVIRAVAGRTKPSAVIAVDALASRSLDRLCRTVQLSDTGIVPGSGVGNAREALNAETLGAPVVAVGVPTVVDAATLAADVAGEAGAGRLDPEALKRRAGGMIVTPREIDTEVADISRLIGYGIDLALHDGLTPTDVDMFLG